MKEGKDLDYGRHHKGACFPAHEAPGGRAQDQCGAKSRGAAVPHGSRYYSKWPPTS